MTAPETGPEAAPVGNRAARAALWLPGLAVALGAAAATAHGLFETAAAARVPAGLAWLYPLITDGLALVAYAATARLSGRAARYAWSVVVLAAGLSGLAQAAYLAGGPAAEVSPVLRFGIGAWPAVAAAIVAHLLYLLAAHDSPTGSVQPGRGQPGVHPAPFTPPAVQPGTDTDPYGPVQPRTQDAAPMTVGPGPTRRTLPPSPARDRAAAAATRHAQRRGAWPTVSEVETAAEVSRGTAAAALKDLREQPLPLRLITDPHPGGPNDRDEAHP